MTAARVRIGRLESGPADSPARNHTLMGAADESSTMPGRDPAALARGYYRSIDVGDYEALAALLAPDFVQVRDDRTIDGREAFVRFVAEERPDADTAHEVDAVYRAAGDGDEEVGGGRDDVVSHDIAVRGRLLRADGSVWFGFVDAFEVEGGRLSGLTTYTNGRVG